MRPTENTDDIRIFNPCGSICWILGLGFPMGPVLGCSEDDGHEGPHKLTLAVAKPNAEFVITWTDKL